MFVRSDDGVYRSTLLGAHAWLRHGFGSRLSDSWPGEYTRVKQIHSSVVAVATAGRDLPEHSDAVVTQELGRWVGIRTADCVPVLVADPVHRVVAAIHAGWRGTVAEIVCRTVETMASEFGSDPARLIAAIGPCIGADAFEVGPEVVDAFRGAFGVDAPVGRTPRGTPGIDLRRAVHLQLLRAGFREDQVDTTDCCTVRDRDEFFSHRRDNGLTGRMAAVIGVRAG